MDYYYIGEIQLFPYSYAPEGFMLCDGTAISISQYQVLFALIGTTYGGDGHNTFAVPNLNNAAPFKGTSIEATGMKYYIAYEGVFPQRS